MLKHGMRPQFEMSILRKTCAGTEASFQARQMLMPRTTSRLMMARRKGDAQSCGNMSSTYALV